MPFGFIEKPSWALNIPEEKKDTSSESIPEWVARQYNTPLIDRTSGWGEELLKKMRNPTLSEVGPNGELFPQREEAAFYSGALEGITKPSTIVDAVATVLGGVPAAIASGVGAAADAIQVFNPKLSKTERAMYGVGAVTGGASSAASGILKKADISPIELLMKRFAGELEPGAGGLRGFFSLPKVKQAAGAIPVQDAAARVAAGELGIEAPAPLKQKELLNSPLDPKTPAGLKLIVDRSQNPKTELSPLEHKTLITEFDKNPKGTIATGVFGPEGRPKYTPVQEAETLQSGRLYNDKKWETEQAKLTNQEIKDDKEILKFKDQAKKTFEQASKREGTNLNTQEKYGTQRAKDIEAQIEADSARTGVEQTGDGLEEIKRTITRKYTTPIEGGTETGTVTLGKPKGKEPPKQTFKDDPFNPNPQAPTNPPPTTPPSTPIQDATSPAAPSRFYLDTPANRRSLVAKAKTEGNLQVIAHDDGTLELVPFAGKSTGSTGTSVSEPYPTYIQAEGFQKKYGGKIEEVSIGGKKRYQVVPGESTPVAPKSTEPVLEDIAGIDESGRPLTGPGAYAGPERRGPARPVGSAEDEVYERARQGVVAKNQAAQVGTDVEPGSGVPPIVDKGNVGKSTATFIGWGEGPDGTRQPWFNYEIEPGVNTTTVGEDVLRSKGIEVPKYPEDTLDVEAATQAAKKAAEDRFKAVDEPVIPGRGGVAVEEPPTPRGIIPVADVKRSKADILGEHYRSVQAEAKAKGEKFPRDASLTDLTDQPRAQGARIAGKGLSQMGPGKPSTPPKSQPAFADGYQQDLDDLAGLDSETRKKIISQLIKSERDPEAGQAGIEAISSLTGGLGGAAIGAATGDEDDRIPNAIFLGAMGAGAGYMAPSAVMKMMGEAEASGDENLIMQAAQKAKNAAVMTVKLWPDIQRFNFLSNLVNLPINAFIGPYGSALMRSIEAVASGEEWGKPALKALLSTKIGDTNLPIPGGNFAKGLYRAHKEMKAQDFIEDAFSRHEVSETFENAPKWVRNVLAAPGRTLTLGDISARNVLMDAGAPEAAASAGTLTDEGSMPVTKWMQGMKRGPGSRSWTAQTTLPFVRTLANQVEGSAERFPILGEIAQKARLLEGEIPDEKNVRFVQQALGTGVIGTSAMLGFLIPPDPVMTPIYLKLLGNAGGQYGLLAVGAFSAGQAAQMGDTNPLKTFGSNFLYSLPLPSTSSMSDYINFGDKLLTGEVSLEDTPSGMMPTTVKRTLTGKNVITGE